MFTQNYATINIIFVADSDDDEIMASSPPPQCLSASQPSDNMTSTATGVPPVVDLTPAGGGSSSYQVPQFPIERIECKMAAISSRFVFLELINFYKTFID